MLAHFRGDLRFGEFVDGFYADDLFTETFGDQALLEFAFGFAGADDEDGRRVVQLRNDVVVVRLQMARVLTVAMVFRRALLRRMSAETHVFFNIRHHVFRERFAVSIGAQENDASLWSIHSPVFRFMLRSLFVANECSQVTRESMRVTATLIRAIAYVGELPLPSHHGASVARWFAMSVADVLVAGGDVAIASLISAAPRKPSK